MSSTQIVTLRMPLELKKRLEQEARSQGVSINQLANYLLNVQVTQLEVLSALESRLKSRSIEDLKKRVRDIFDRIPSRDVPEWDKIE